MKSNKRQKYFSFDTFRRLIKEEIFYREFFSASDLKNQIKDNKNEAHKQTIKKNN